MSQVASSDDQQSIDDQKSHDDEFLLDNIVQDTICADDVSRDHQEGGIMQSRTTPRPRNVDRSGTTKNRIAEQLGTLTHSAVGHQDIPLPCLSLVSSKTKSRWIQSLSSTGYATLLYVDMRVLQGSPGFDSSGWFDNRKRSNRTLVKTPLEPKPCAGILTLQHNLPRGSIINSVICTLSELLSCVNNVSYCASTPQLFLPSQGGFSQEFRLDEQTTELTSYRSFWHLGPEQMYTGTLESIARHEYVFIGSAGDNIREYAGHKVVTLSGFFGEADRKFCLYPGDILVMDAKNPFAVDLPIGGRAKGSRILSWTSIPKTDTTEFPIITKSPGLVMNIEEMISTCEAAKSAYSEEFEVFEVTPGPIGDPEGHMQRLRVTPKKYCLRDVMKEVENNSSIHYLNSEYFHF